jgi:hypothetical protein
MVVRRRWWLSVMLFNSSEPCLKLYQWLQQDTWGVE